MAMTFKETSWPPRSPHEALLSSPSGRKKLSQRYARRSLSPSPFKRQPTLGLPEVEEDEETLKLQLKRIEAKLKLKRLQAQSQSIGYSESLGRNCVGSAQPRPKANSGELLTANTDRLEGRNRTQTLSKKLQTQSQTVGHSGSLHHVGVELSQSRTRAISNGSSTANANRLERHDSPRPQPNSTTSLQVPVSPPRKHIVTEQPRSPGRVLLGIDKGLKGKDVSLRRAPYLKSKQQSPRSSNHNHRRTLYTTAPETETKTQAKTFSERMTELRANTSAEKKRVDETHTNRSKGFNVDRKEVEELKKKADKKSATSTSQPYRHTRTNEPGFSREEILKSYNKPTGGLLHRETTASGVRNTRETHMKIEISSRTTSRRTSPTSPEPSYRRSTMASEARKSPPRPTSSRAAKQPSAEPAEGFDKHSGLHLSRRVLPEAFLARTLREKKILRVPDLLRGDDAHDVDGDIVVMGVIASKSAPRDHKESHKTTASQPASPTTATDAPRGKYMAMTLTDLKWEITLFLFASAFRRFWKLTPGTVVAILNPTIMPPRPSDPTGTTLSLALSSPDDTLLELGTARDLGYCASIRRDGQPCAAWLDARHTAHCAFHVDRQLDRTRAARMELHSIPTAAPGAARGGRGGARASSGRGRGQTGLLREGPQYDRGSASRYFVAGRSAAALLDEEEGGRAGGAERLRLRLAAREKERDVARRLGALGGGVGGEYLSRVAGAGPEGGEEMEADGPPPRLDARALGLVRSGAGAGAVTLSPAKKRGRRERSRSGSGVERTGKGRKRGRWEEEEKRGGEEEEEEDIWLAMVREMSAGRSKGSSGESDGLEIV